MRSIFNERYNESAMGRWSAEECVGERSPGRLLRRINKLWPRLAQRIDDPAFTFVHWMALKRVYDGAVSNAGELAREMDLTTGAATRLIDSLEALGLFRRDRLAGDRRVRLLKLTDAGRRKYLETLPVMLTSWNAVLADFDDAEFGHLVHLLTKLLNAFERLDRDHDHGVPALSAEAPHLDSGAI